MVEHGIYPWHDDADRFSTLIREAQVLSGDAHSRSCRLILKFRFPFSKRKNQMADTTASGAALPPDDASRKLTVADPDDPAMGHISVAGGTYTILVTGKDTGGRYCLIDMRIPSGGGPPPHRHDFEEMFTILDGEIEFSFRGEPRRAAAGSTVNVPANAPHAFKNMSDKPARLLCMCLPAGQEEFFLAVGDPVGSRTAPPPKLSSEERAERIQRAKALSAKYRTELLV
jgi:quercetin dioxygenase-like cupin family protein